MTGEHYRLSVFCIMYDAREQCRHAVASRPTACGCKTNHTTLTYCTFIHHRCMTRLSATKSHFIVASDINQSINKIFNVLRAFYPPQQLEQPTPSPFSCCSPVSVRNKGGQEGVRPPKSMRDQCKVVICRDPGGPIKTPSLLTA